MITMPPPTTNLASGVPIKEMSGKRDFAADQSRQRTGEYQQLNQAMTENHGFEAKEYIKAALTNNTKIINTPVLQRGSLLDVRI